VNRTAKMDVKPTGWRPEGITNIKIVCGRNIHRVGISFPFFGEKTPFSKTEQSGYFIVING
jgi:hypothetical protein